MPTSKRAVIRPARLDAASGIPRPATGGRRAVDPVLDFALATVVGLADRPRWLPSRFLYDEHGSRLFERITEVPEYYLTRTETAILAAAAPEIRAITGPRRLIELGSGSSTKTRHLLSAYTAGSDAAEYVPVDVSHGALLEARAAIGRTHPMVHVQAIHGTYETVFPLLRTLSPAMLVFLGSTIGNLDRTEAFLFWGDVGRNLRVGDFVLLGADLVKDAAVLNAAYNDAAGYSAAFTKNIFARMNRELGAGIDLSQIDHRAFYNESWQRVEIYAEFATDQSILVRPLERTVRVHAGERVMTEISRKFAVKDLEEYLPAFGLEVRRVFTDERGWYAVLLLERVADA